MEYPVSIGSSKKWIGKLDKRKQSRKFHGNWKKKNDPQKFDN